MIELFTEHIKNSVNFCFVKFGDSELLCMDGREGKNADNHPFSQQLCKELNDAFSNLANRFCYFAEWKGPWAELYPRSRWKVPFVDYETLLPTAFNPKLKEILKFYDAIRESKRKKIYVGPTRNRDVIALLGIDTFIEVPEENCYAAKERITESLMREWYKDCIILFSCTMLANVLMDEVTRVAYAFMGNSITCLDVGSAFDPYCGIQNRSRQMTVREARAYFDEWRLPVRSLDKTWFVRIRNPRDRQYYPSYNDYFRLVELSGFQWCDLEDVQPDSDNTYIITLNYDGPDQGPIPDKYFGHARMILHQLERFNIVDERYDEIWLYDRSMPELSHPKCKYVILGGHKDFMEPVEVEKRYDFYHMCFLYGRRHAMILGLIEKGCTFSDCPEEWPFKNRRMQQSRIGLALHQHPNSMTLIEPLRLTVFSCMKLPILAEHSRDFHPYKVYSYEQFLIDGNLHEITNWEDNYKLFTETFTFENCIKEALEL